MPLYEYECDACGERYELIRKFSDPPLDVCPKCGQGPVRKLVSSPAFHLKGSGWYKTDYAAKPAETDKSASAKAAKSEGGGKSETSEKPSSDTATTTETTAAAAEKPAVSTSTNPGKPEKT